LEKYNEEKTPGQGEFGAKGQRRKGKNERKRDFIG
jgi:hypothetical protein